MIYLIESHKESVQLHVSGMLYKYTFETKHSMISAVLVSKRGSLTKSSIGKSEKEGTRGVQNLTKSELIINLLTVYTRSIKKII